MCCHPSGDTQLCLPSAEKTGRNNSYHFPFGAEEGMALERLVALALCDVGKHLIVHLISSAVRDPAERSMKYTDGLGRDVRMESQLKAEKQSQSHEVINA